MSALIADRAQAREVGDENEEKRRVDNMPLIGGERRQPRLAGWVFHRDYAPCLKIDAVAADCAAAMS